MIWRAATVASFLCLIGSSAIAQGVSISCAGVDDTAAIQAALDANPSVYVPPGANCVAGNLTINHDMEVYGAGTTSRIAMKPGAAGFLLTTGPHAVHLHDFSLDGGNTADQRALTSPPDARSGLQVFPDYASRVHGMRVNGFGSYCYYFNDPAGSAALVDRALFEGSWASNCYWGVLVDAFPGNEYITMRGISINQSAQALSDWCGNLNASNLTIANNGYGVRLMGGYLNGGHGIISNSLVNHSIYNSLYASGVGYGYNLIGNNFILGNIEIAASVGIKINDGTISVGTLTFAGGGYNSVSHNYMLITPANGLIDTVVHSGDQTVVCGNFQDNAPFSMNMTALACP